MVRGEVFDTISFDEEFEWWFGDDDIVAQIECRGGKIGIVGATSVHHVNGGSQTMIERAPDVYPTLMRDYERMLTKWGHT
jgi:hypothetical protein